MGETPAQRRRRVHKERRAAAARPRQRRKRQERRRRQLKRWGQPAFALVLVGALVGGIWYVVTLERREALARLDGLVSVEPDLGRAHVASTTDDPAPTSGPHLAPAFCGVAHEPLTADVQIHSLEHGSVLFQYRPDAASDDDVEALAALAVDFGSHVTVAPNPRLETPFVVTAWRRKMELDAVDLDRAHDFAIAFRERGPERTDCDI